MDVVELNVFVRGTSTFVASVDALIFVLFLCDRLLLVIRFDLIEFFIVDIVDVRVESTLGITIALSGFSKWVVSGFL